MNGEVLSFGEVAADKVTDLSLIGIESNGRFELHEVITKTTEENNRLGLAVCRSFLLPEKIITLSFWTDMDKKVFIPTNAVYIKDFVVVDPKETEAVCSSSVAEADLKFVHVEKVVHFYGEKRVASGKIKYALIHGKNKFDANEVNAMSGAMLKRCNTHAIFGVKAIARRIRQLRRLGYKEKTMLK